ncbi:MAG: hypothetical protein K2J77_11100 [Oscillospiraceae bacterium]|nr:hypothetical protein [Oscillospiraceae bacterium]
MKKLFAFISLASILALSGCYPTEKKIYSEISSDFSETSNTEIESSHFEYSKDNLSAHFDFPEIPDKLPSRIKLKEKIFDRQKAIELLFNGEAPASEYLYGEHNECGQYISSDGSELIIEGNKIAYYNGKFDDENLPVAYFPIMNSCREHFRDKFSITENELEEFPLQTALKTANDLIFELGIEGLGEPEIYAVSLASYEKIREDDPQIFNDEISLTKDNEIYVFRFPQEINGVKLSDINVDIKDSTREWASLATSSSFVVGVSKDGIFEFYIDAAYETDVEILNDEAVKYNFSHAVSELRSHFEKVIFTRSKSVVISKAEVIYFPVERNEIGTMEFLPAWSFNGYCRDYIFEEKLNCVSPWDFRFIVTTDAGVVREYSEV